jgi:hypothetical protein
LFDDRMCTEADDGSNQPARGDGIRRQEAHRVESCVD